MDDTLCHVIAKQPNQKRKKLDEDDVPVGHELYSIVIGRWQQLTHQAAEALECFAKWKQTYCNDLPN